MVYNLFMPNNPEQESSPSFLQPKENTVKKEAYSLKTFPKKKVLIAVVATLLLLIIAIGIYSVLTQRSPLSTFPQVTNETAKDRPEGAIAKVGDEYIYQKDLDLELAAYPPMDSLEERERLLLEKISTDSAILQGAKADGIITNLDTDIYNSSNKDYFKRVHMVEQIKSKISEEAGKTKGVIVSIWFYNFGVPAPIGYDKGKEMAFQKITRLHAEVKSGKMTIEQAVESIRKDPDMKQLDPYSYEGNARQEFNTAITPLISFNKDLEKQLLELPEGDVSDIVLSTEPMFDKPGFYQFGQVTNKVNNNKFFSFDSWFSKIKKNYAITLY